MIRTQPYFLAFPFPQNKAYLSHFKLVPLPLIFLNGLLPNLAFSYFNNFFMQEGRRASRLLKTLVIIYYYSSNIKFYPHHPFFIIQIQVGAKMLQKSQGEHKSRPLFSNYEEKEMQEMFPTDEWTEAWTEVENHFFTYLCTEQSKLLYPYISQKIRQTIVLHKNIDIIQELKKEMGKIFERIFSSFVEDNIDENQPFRSFVCQYNKIVHKLKVVINCLYQHMSKYVTKSAIEKQISAILVKQLMAASFYEQFYEDFICLVERYRDVSLEPKPINIQIIEAMERQFDIVVKINLFAKMYPQYIDRSKKYYGELLTRIPKNIHMFTILHNYLYIEGRLNKILESAEKGCKKQSMMYILWKEVLDELYGSMIEYLDYLISKEGQKEGENIELGYFWEIRKVCSEVSRSQNYEKKFNGRLVEIFSDVKKNMKSAESLCEIIREKELFQSIIMKYFDDDSKLSNILNNTIEEVLMKEEQTYNTFLCSIILHHLYQWYSSEEEMKPEDISLQSQFVYPLFKLTPSKEQFIRKFQQQFSKYVLVNESKDLREQAKFIKAISRECGNTLSKNIERMLADVWKNDKFLHYKHELIICRVISKDWPPFIGKSFSLPDSLVQIRERFEEHFLSFEENEKKKLEWVPQCGTIILKVCGVESVFSELQASIVILLSRSFRPMKIHQLSEILNYEQKELGKTMRELVRNNIITLDDESAFFELNNENNHGYEYKLSEESIQNKQKEISVRDYGILIEASLTRIIKKKKIIQKTDLMKLLPGEIKNYRPQIDEINRAIEKLKTKDIISIEKVRGMIRYVE